MLGPSLLLTYTSYLKWLAMHAWPVVARIFTCVVLKLKLTVDLKAEKLVTFEQRR